MLRKNVKSLLEQFQVCIFAEIVFGVRCTLRCLRPTNIGLHPARFRAIKPVAPSVLLLRMAVINILFYSTGQSFKIKSHITCETFNVIYMIQCTKCNLQYIGETKRRLKDRFYEHRRPIINPFCSYTFSYSVYISRGLFMSFLVNIKIL